MVRLSGFTVTLNRYHGGFFQKLSAGGSDLGKFTEKEA